MSAILTTNQNYDVMTCTNLKIKIMVIN